MIPRFSIIVPLYNKAPYVRKAIDSVVSQTFKDWECIIVDDGSTDGSADIVREYVHTLQIAECKLQILSQKNSGVAAARNNGVKASSGEYVCFLDADDWWEPTFLEEMDKLIADYPDAGIYASNYIYYKPGKTHVALSLLRGYMDYPKAYYEQGAMPVTSITTCMPRKVFDEMGGFPVGIKLGEDFLLWAKTTIHYPAAFCEKPLAYYNNDVPASLRATRNLHAPQYHMLFLLEPLEAEIAQLPDASLRADWKALVDKLRVSGLMDYWLSGEYHDAAAVELAKVDWSMLPKRAQSRYEQPVWLLKLKKRILQTGSYVKQKWIHIVIR